MDIQPHPILAIAGLFGLGVLHGVGADHLAALGTIAAKRGSLREALLVALRFGAGHAGVLAVGAGLCLLLGLAIPEAFERVAEISGGGVVALLGALAVIEATGVVRIHSHAHGVHDEHAHPHVHVGMEHRHAGHGHRHGATLVGALMAVSGLRGLLALVPAAAQRSPVVLGGSVLAFGVGVVVSMVIAALAGAGAAWLGGRAGLRPGARTVRGLVGAASFAVGVFWIVDAW
ncbi:Nickel transporter UreH [Vulgatibacter incomptus]|uniref:Nickel transporter UreH n=2 Tax=Vulgatibacter incomptus TaxID=1391653 RepID=A0A0K1PFX5_9BACT|nr:Nickel transporter UreH [Vulgatibacter incomptus]